MIPLDAIKNDDRVFQSAAGQITSEILGSLIDHTNLKPTASGRDIEALCNEADEIGSYICVHGSRVEDANIIVLARGPRSKVRGIAAVLDFPLGAGTTKEKVSAAEVLLCNEGVDEIDMVMNVGKFLEGNLPYVQKDILAVAKMMRAYEKHVKSRMILKVIQENCLLPSPAHIRDAAMITAAVALETGLSMFAKTSTGFGKPKDERTAVGATLDDVWHMHRAVRSFRAEGARIGVKAAGGVGDAEMAVRMMLAGGCFDEEVTIKSGLPNIFRIGASAGKKIVDDFIKRFSQE